MKKYTANYTYTNPNFVIQNLKEIEVDSPLRPLLYVLKNLLQRGYPTVMSKFLQKEIGSIHTLSNYEDRLLLISPLPPIWHDTIKGDMEKNYYPARTFLESVIPTELGEYGFIQSMLI